MTAPDFWTIAWQNAHLWRMIFAFFCGIAVGIAYFRSMHWSISHLDKFKHKIRIFALMAFLRIAMFLGVLVLVCERNPVLILIYILSFFITKLFVVAFTKGLIGKEDR